MKRLLLTAVLLCWAAILFGQKYLPSSHGELVEHTYITLSYSEANEQAEWVYYELTPKFVAGNIKRSDNFRPDPKVSTVSAQLADYAGSGYDRGHLCPAGSMTLNATAMSESFYLSNMSPQLPEFNRGGWKKLESLVREWAVEYDRLYVITGPVLKGTNRHIGLDKVTVPNFYYKVIYAPNQGMMIAFVMPNAKIDHELNEYVVDVDEVERVTGIDFFEAMDDQLENQLESNVTASRWDFDGTQARPKMVEKAKGETSGGQCQGITASGSRCKRKAKAGSKYCFQHENL
ncbi:DNA/RNA non-specific endonuclease [Mangrovibacterium lignilyticum]|uniref:DNA/RNA non-specific endonuclease n=1 Tax=Mangrovibacterium lignilyticum TaxID=2668052 RepID=UPI0013D2A809|nr:DNA/RNA non-specific endonuclease [Mangrovibacterium lignilyticum]